MGSSGGPIYTGTVGQDACVVDVVARRTSHDGRCVVGSVGHLPQDYVSSLSTGEYKFGEIAIDCGFGKTAVIKKVNTCEYLGHGRIISRCLSSASACFPRSSW